ncbi:MAG: DUF3343 domain-containing protein [Oscillospiraceae bacterium]|nr:DUF3343 domain-containing protein [Oscillospiraceae bacterium]
MKEFFVTFRSITFAQRGQAALRSGGISSSMARTPRWMEEKGCGYSLRVGGAHGQEAVALLKKRAIPYSKIYKQGESGEMEEIML